jgi:hypothetical protein
MTAFAPSAAQIQAQVRHLMNRDPNSSVIGIRARTLGAWPNELAVDSRRFRLAWCESPLAVRQLLTDDVASLEGIVVLTPLSDGGLGADVLSRFARGRLLAIDTSEMLCAAFQARHIDSRLRSKDWIADELLDRVPPGGYPPVAGGVLDADTAWRHLLDRTLGLAEARPDAERLLQWTIEDGAIERFTSLPSKLKEEIASWLSSVSGAAGSLIVDCVTSGNGLDALPLGLVCSVIFPKVRVEHDLVAAAVRLENYVNHHKVDLAAAHQWSDASTRLLSKGDYASFRRWLDRADQLLQHLHIFAYAAASRILPSGFEARLIEHAKALESALGSSSDESLEALEASAKAVLTHQMASQESARAQRAEMALRLIRWLRAGSSSVQSLGQAARNYARDGGYVDWARRVLMGGDENAHVSAAYLMLVEKVRERREAENRTFAQLLKSWNSAVSKEGTVTPLESVLSTIVVPLAQRQLPLLLLVVDGLSFSVFRELSVRLGELGWIELIPADLEEAAPAIAALPTITEVSRASLLSGSLTRGNAHAEKAAFTSHSALVAVSSRGKPPKLFHKGDLGSAAGLPNEVREALADPGQRIVGIVHNAIDDHLDGPDQLHISWSIDDIRALRSVLREARDAGRILIIASDHGHVLEESTTVRASDGGDRWRRPTGNVSDGEIEVAGGRVLTPDGNQVVVMPWSERIRYASKKNGYHGGATLQEVVIPLCVLSPLLQVDGWKEAPPPTPAWWQERTAGQQSSVTITASRLVAAPLAIDHDLPLFAKATQPSVVAEDWISGLLSSSAYAAQTELASRGAPREEDVRKILEGLRTRGGKLSKLALAQNAGIPLFRLSGILSAVRRVINIDQSPILMVDDGAETVELNVDLLRRQFDLAPKK